jgi:vesicle-associated membrane protein 72
MAEDSSTGNAKIAQLKQEVASISNIMHSNIEKGLKRGEDLNDIMARTDELQESSVIFNRRGTQLRRKLWLQGIRLYIILGCISVTLLAVFAVIIFVIVTNVHIK